MKENFLSLLIFESSGQGNPYTVVEQLVFCLPGHYKATRVSCYLSYGYDFAIKMYMIS